MPTLTPLEVFLLAAAAGLLATLVLSLLSRVVPGMRNLTHRGGSEAEAEKRGQPVDPFNPEVVRAWQDEARSPARHPRRGVRAPFTPEGALVKAQGPGPEGAAAEFAVKLLAGLFGRDITGSAKRAGKVVHFTYGSLWGGIYGLVQASVGVPWLIGGLVHGLWVWAVGPGLLVPMMRVLLPPRALRPVQNALLIGGHLVYGIVVAFGFRELVSWRST